MVGDNNAPSNQDVNRYEGVITKMVAGDTALTINQPKDLPVSNVSNSPQDFEQTAVGNIPQRESTPSPRAMPEMLTVSGSEAVSNRDERIQQNRQVAPLTQSYSTPTIGGPIPRVEGGGGGGGVGTTSEETSYPNLTTSRPPLP